MQFTARKRRSPPAVIIVSLIDVLMVVLIFLMVTTTFRQQPAVKLTLPESKQAKEGVTDKANFMKAELFESDFSQAQVITMFLLPDINMKLRPKILDLKPGTRIVSNTFTMGEWVTDESAIEKKFGPHAAIKQVTHRMLSTSDIQIDLSPIITFFLAAKGFFIMRIHIAKEIPRRIYEGIHRVSIAFCRCAALRTWDIDPLIDRTQWR